MKHFGIFGFILILSISKLFSQQLLWEKTYNSPQGLDFQNVVDIAQSKDNNLYILSYLSDTLPGRINPAITKINPMGEIIWSFLQINEKCIYPRFIIENISGFNFYGIRVRSFGFDEAGFTPYKYEFDNNNNLISECFEPNVKGSNTGNNGALLLTKDSLLLNISYWKKNIIIKEYDVNSKYIRDIKLDTTAIRYMPNKAFQDIDSNLYLCGTFTHSDDDKNFILKLSKNYEKIWLVADSLEPDRSILEDVEYLPNGNFVLSGRIRPSNLADSAKARIFIKVYNSDGKLLVNKQYPTSIFTHVFDIDYTKDGCFIMAGDSAKYSYDKKYLTLKTFDSLGIKMWEKAWGDNTKYNTLRELTTTDDNLIYVAGRSDSFLYIACLKNGPVSVVEKDNNDKSLLENPKLYPNPANEMLSLSINMSKTDNLKIDLYNNTGRAIKTLFEENLEGGKYCLELPLPVLVPGCYNLVISTGDGNRHTEKVIVN